MNRVATYDAHSCDISRDSQSWHSPNSSAELIATVKTLEETSSSYKLVCGNTSVGIYKQDEDNSQFSHLINLRNVRELHKTEKNNQTLTIGSAVCLQDLIQTFETVAKEDEPNFGHLRESANHLRRVASGHVRNVASWSGNLALKRKHPEFPSDVLVILESIGARLNVLNFGRGEKFANSLDLGLIDYLTTDKLGNHLIESMQLHGFDQSQVKIKVKRDRGRLNKNKLINLDHQGVQNGTSFAKLAFVCQLWVTIHSGHRPNRERSAHHDFQWHLQNVQQSNQD